MAGIENEDFVSCKCPSYRFTDPRIIPHRAYGREVVIGKEQRLARRLPGWIVRGLDFVQYKDLLDTCYFEILPRTASPVVLVQGPDKPADARTILPTQVVDYVIEGHGYILVKGPQTGIQVFPVDAKKPMNLAYKEGVYVAYIAGGGGLGIVSVGTPDKVNLMAYSPCHQKVPREIWDEYIRLRKLVEQEQLEVFELPVPYLLMFDQVDLNDGSITKYKSGLVAINKVLPGGKPGVYIHAINMKYDSRGSPRYVAELMARLKIHAGIEAAIGRAVDFYSFRPEGDVVPSLGLESGSIGLYLKYGEHEFPLESLPKAIIFKGEKGHQFEETVRDLLLILPKVRS
jgi:hypothetical protein